MITMILDFIGLDMSVIHISDDVQFIIGSLFLLFAVAEVFRLLEIVVDRLTRKR